jgi:methylenetetrahydrofolate reductase (NADPH)
LRGDAPRPDEYAEAESSQTIDEFNHADDLVRYIRAKHGDFFCIGVAGYPTPHPDAESADADMHWLKNKCDAGADYIITQLFYDVGQFEAWVGACRVAGE